ncbi:MAG: thioredoxin domain-containing protein [Sporolactobacillus sp.]
MDRVAHFIEKTNGRKRQPAHIFSLLVAAGVGAVVLSVFVFLRLTVWNQEAIQLAPAQVFPLQKQPYLGSMQAKNTIIEFSDYGCYWSVRFHRTVYRRIVTNLVQTGRAKLYEVNCSVTGADAERAAVAARYIYERYPAHFFAFHEALFKQIEKHKSGWASRLSLLRVVKRIVPQINKLAFLAAISDDSYRRQIEATNHAAFALGVPGTPTLLVNGKAVDPFNYTKISSRMVR